MGKLTPNHIDCMATMLGEVLRAVYTKAAHKKKYVTVQRVAKLFVSFGRKTLYIFGEFLLLFIFQSYLFYSPGRFTGNIIIFMGSLRP